MASAERRPVRVVLAETRSALDLFEERLNEFSTVLDELDAEMHRQNTRRKGRP